MDVKLIHQINRGGDGPQWLKDVAQKAKENMKKHSHSFQSPQHVCMQPPPHPKTQSLYLSREVPNEHDHLKTMIQGLLPQIHTAMSAMDELQQEEEILERLQLEIPDLGAKNSLTPSKWLTREELISTLESMPQIA